MLRFQKTPDVADELRDVHPAASLLRRSHRLDQATEIFNEKVRARPLILRPSSPDPLSKDARSSRRLKRLRKKEHFLRKQKPRPLSAKERRKLGVHDIPEDKASRTWKTYLPLRDLWQEYAREILDIEPPVSDDAGSCHYVTGASVGPKLAAADFHGAELQVVRSNCVSRVGVQGIVLKDTKFTFELITPQNDIKIIPKAHTVFRFHVDRIRRKPVNENEKHEGDENAGDSPQSPPKPFIFEIHGDQFETRPADRATKKFKPKRLDHI